MIRAKELERVLPKGQLRREPGKRGRYQLVLRHLDAPTVLALVDPLWEVFFPSRRPVTVQVDREEATYSCTVFGRKAVLFCNGELLAEGLWTQLDGQLDLYWSSQREPPSDVISDLSKKVRKEVDWRRPPDLG